MRQPSKTSGQEPRLYRVVAGKILDLIHDEKIAAGERLPAERDLAKKLNVSRSCLREAIISIELSGQVEVRSGSGVYVCKRPETRNIVHDGGPGPFEVLSARRLIEPEIAAIAARIATDGDIETILQSVVDMERSQNNAASNETADRHFHLSIARASGNAAMVGATEYLWSQRGQLWHRLTEHYETEELRRETLSDHRRVLSAIAGRDPARARHAMRAHLERVTRVFSQG